MPLLRRWVFRGETGRQSEGRALDDVSSRGEKWHLKPSVGHVNLLLSFLYRLSAAPKGFPSLPIKLQVTWLDHQPQVSLNSQLTQVKPLLAKSNWPASWSAAAQRLQAHHGSFALLVPGRRTHQYQHIVWRALRNKRDEEPNGDRKTNIVKGSFGQVTGAFDQFSADRNLNWREMLDGMLPEPFGF